VWYCVSEDFCVTILCYDCHKYRNHMHLKIIDHMNRMTIYVHDITEHNPENVLRRLKKEVKIYDVIFNLRNFSSAVGKLLLYVLLEFLHCRMFEKKIMYMDSYFVCKMPV
jgi:hypothetical protein